MKFVHDLEYLIDQLLVSAIKKILESKLTIILISLLWYIFYTLPYNSKISTN
jgi:hypothetical protein